MLFAITRKPHRPSPMKVKGPLQLLNTLFQLTVSLTTNEISVRYYGSSIPEVMEYTDIVLGR